MHGKLTFAALGASLCLNAVLIIYCANLSFMSPLAHDRQAEIAALKAQDQMLQSQKSALEKTTKGLQEQKEQLLKHYSETEHVGKKLEKYKEKLRADAEEVKDAEAAAELLMQRLATAQGNTLATKDQLAAEKEKLEKAKKELKGVEHEEKVLKRSEKTDRLVKALEKDESKIGPHERQELCHDCTCVKYC